MDRRIHPFLEGKAMAGRQIKNRLVPLNVERIKQPGMHPDGGGLYLRVSDTGAKSWIFRYSAPGGKRPEMGLGAFPTVGLAEAREKAEECRKLRVAGKNPIEVREAAILAAKLEAARQMTFRQCAEAYIETHRATWKNAKHAYQWPQSLSTFVYPIFGDLPVQAIDVGLVLKALKPIWREKTETAIRTRGRIERILDWATASGYRKGDNPARWRGHLSQLLPAPSKIAKVEHHAALPYREIGGFMRDLRKQGGTAARALEFAILTAARTSEALGATFAEFDLAAKVWSIPGERMKAGKPHRVPLSAAALDLLKAQRGATEGDFVFPGARRGKPLSNMAMLKLMERMGRGDLTSHGFRSTFRDWAGEQTAYPREVIEAALAHALESKVEAAYARGDLIEKRARLMETWATYCDRIPEENANDASVSNVVALGGSR